MWSYTRRVRSARVSPRTHPHNVPGGPRCRNPSRFVGLARVGISAEKDNARRLHEALPGAELLYPSATRLIGGRRMTMTMTLAAVTSRQGPNRREEGLADCDAAGRSVWPAHDGVRSGGVRDGETGSLSKWADEQAMSSNHAAGINRGDRVSSPCACCRSDGRFPSCRKPLIPAAAAANVLRYMMHPARCATGLRPRRLVLCLHLVC